ncbi:hypothetical protein GWI33_019149 [Rhynchophorus ferrugineus]|uniref:Uncharacterized protein n=1 Tax=Rhynchophorus ferrugineus TaxID=354439 RepID=A0A834M5L3_RHYFE|nr:hypothetical protein GWI33_019149 [Rhynchophorus ferrugineus]
MSIEDIERSGRTKEIPITRVPLIPNKLPTSVKHENLEKTYLPPPQNKREAHRVRGKRPGEARGGQGVGASRSEADVESSLTQSLISF